MNSRQCGVVVAIIDKNGIKALSDHPELSEEYGFLILIRVEIIPFITRQH
jgi:hypothetical protein